MFEITIQIPGLTEAINALAAAIREAGNIPAPAEKTAVREEIPTNTADPEKVKPEATKTETAPAVPKPENRPPAPAAPQPAPAPQAAPAAPQPVPTPPTAPAPAPERQYTFNDISKAGAALCGAGKMDQLITLLNDKYKVQAITELKPDVYGQLAADLIALGAEL